MLDDQLRRALDRRREAGQLRTLRRYDVGDVNSPSGSGEERHTAHLKTPLVDFSSNDYMGLSRSRELQDAFMKKMQSTTQLPLGSTGSRLLDGNTSEHEALEQRLYRHFDSPAALLFNSGFDANASLLGVLPQPGDFIIYDELVHASMHDGMRASRIPLEHRIAFRHNDITSLRMVIKDVLARGQGSSNHLSPNIFVAVESIYSMDGDACPLPELLQVVNELVPRRQRCVVVDEAHAVGLYGRNGAGLVAELGLCDNVDVRLATFGKAFGSSGAVVLCGDLVKQYLVNYARPLVYSTALPNITLRIIDAALNVMCSDIGGQRAKKTFELTDMLLTSLASQHGSKSKLELPSTPRRAPIVPVHTSRPRDLAAHCIAHGYLVRPIVYPTVPKGRERVRICVHGSNTRQEVDGLARCIRQWFEARAAEGTPRNADTSASRIPIQRSMSPAPGSSSLLSSPVALKSRL